jgi:hypothetical protein
MTVMTRIKEDDGNNSSQHPDNLSISGVNCLNMTSEALLAANLE